MKAGTHRGRRSPLVLLVQEDDDARETLRQALEYDGLLVVEARVVQEALATLRETPPDVIAVDVAPGVSGLGVCQRLREQSRAERVPIIALARGSSFSFGDERESATETPFVVLGKPCPPEAVIVEIRRLLAPPAQPGGRLGRIGRNDDKAGGVRARDGQEAHRRPWKVLVVDDSQEIRDLFSTGLSLAGFSVTIAADAFAALLITSEHDAIVTDIDMPGMTGLELIKRIRATRGDRLPIVIVTGLCGDVIRQAPPTGSYAVLDKPCDPLALVETLRALLAA